MLSMEACFLTSNSFTKTTTVDSIFVPSIKPRLPTLAFKKRFFTHQFPLKTTSITCSSQGSPSPDEDKKPSNDDWRSFRARLIAGERASRPEEPSTWVDPDQIEDEDLIPHVTIDEKWAHTLHEPERGCLLIATEKLDGVHIFERTVVLLLSMGPVGPTGIILNRPSLMSIKETGSTVLDIGATFSDRPLFFGGPLEEGFFLLSPNPKGSEDIEKSGVFDQVMKGLYYGTKESVGCAAEMVKRNVVGLGDFRFFDGYCGWEKDQLKDEIRAGYWTVAACSPSVIGLTSVGRIGLWEEVLGLMGQRKEGSSEAVLVEADCGGVALSAEECEGLAALQGVKWAISKGYDQILIEGDAQAIINFLKYGTDNIG